MDVNEKLFQYQTFTRETKDMHLKFQKSFMDLKCNFLNILNYFILIIFCVWPSFVSLW